MSLDFRVNGEDVNSKLLIEIYRDYCRVFGIVNGRTDTRYFNRRGIDTLKTEGNINYRPVNGAEFRVRFSDRVLHISARSCEEDSNQLVKEHELFKKIRSIFTLSLSRIHRRYLQVL